MADSEKAEGKKPKAEEKPKAVKPAAPVVMPEKHVPGPRGPHGWKDSFSE